MKRSVIVCCSLAAALACSDGESDRSQGLDSGGSGGSTADAAVENGGSGGAGTGGAGTGGAGTGGAGTAAMPDPCSPEALREPSAAVTYYIAIEEPGADNDACDGLAPTDEGSGHCPFRDLDSERTQHLLDGVASTRVELRRGHYVVHGWDGMRVEGTGQSADERVVLSAYPGEEPVLDVPAPDGEGCTEATAPDDPSCVRQILRLAGQYTVVQGLTIQNGLGYHLEVNGGAHHLVRCNTLGETVAFPMRSDCLKIDGGAQDVEVSHNDFSRFRSQAIDVTDVSDVLIEDNDFHDPIDADAGATGTKFGAMDVTIRGNRVHDMGSDPRMHAFALGGTGSEHPDDQAAYRLRLEANQIWNIAGMVAQLTSCKDCAIEDNEVWDAGAGLLLSASATGSPECTSGTGDGCGPNQGTLIARNRMRALNGGGDAAQANVFVFVEPGEESGLLAEDNVYCAGTAAEARFGLDGELLDFDAWIAAVATDASSQALPASDPRCVF
jgi:hypothetical protein